MKEKDSVLFDSIGEKIENQLKKSEEKTDFMHSQLTLKWVLILKPDADIPLQIAALGHDYDRSFPDRERPKFYKTYKEYKQAHAQKSARMISDLMKIGGFTPGEINRTRKLIENHEVGGDGDLQILTDADSLAFFEWNIPYYRKAHSEEDTKNKIIFMYERMSKNGRVFLGQIKFEDEELKRLYQSAISGL